MTHNYYSCIINLPNEMKRRLQVVRIKNNGDTYLVSLSNFHTLIPIFRALSARF